MNAEEYTVLPGGDEAGVDIAARTGDEEAGAAMFARSGEKEAETAASAQSGEEENGAASAFQIARDLQGIYDGFTESIQSMGSKAKGKKGKSKLAESALHWIAGSRVKTERDVLCDKFLQDVQQQLQTLDYALEGLSQLIHTVNLVKERLNPALALDGVVFTMYDVRTNLSAQVVENVKENLKSHIFETMIPRNIRLAVAPSFGMPITRYDCKSAGADAYLRLADEVIQMK